MRFFRKYTLSSGLENNVAGRMAQLGSLRARKLDASLFLEC